MRRFALKICVFSSILVCLLACLKLSVPYYWGANTNFQAKAKYLASNKKKIDRIVIGSSLTYRAVKPFVVDKFDRSKLTTFNLSDGHTFYFETLYLAKNFGDNYKYKQLLFLAQRPIPIATTNLHSVRTKYYLNFFNILPILKYYKNDGEQLYYYLLSFIENILCVGEITQLISFHFKDKSEIEQSIVKMNKKRGYYSLEDKLKDSNYSDESLLVRKSEFENSLENKNSSKPIRKKLKRYGNPDQRKVYAKSIKKLIKNNASKNIETILLIMPNEGIEKLFKKYKFKMIHMGNASDFPEYFDPKYKFDKGHLNDAGATLFSRRLGKKLNRISKGKINVIL